MGGLILVTILFLISPSFCYIEADSLCAGVPPDEVYLFPYPGDCTKFYACVDGTQISQSCPDGLWFNQAIQTCDHPENSGCSNFVCPPNIVDFYPVPGDCTSYIECYHGTPESHECPAGLWFNAKEKRCTSVQDSNCGEYSTSVEPTWTTPIDICMGVLPGYIILKPYPGDCSKFYQCIGAQDTVMSCPPYLYFDYNRQMCDQPEFSDCDDTTGTPGTTPVDLPTTPIGFDDPRCADGNTEYWPDPDCSKFVECWHGHGYLYDCPGGLYFNPDDNKCEDPSLANCGRTDPTPNPDTTTRGGDWTPDPDCPYPTTDRYLFPYPGDCSLFLECVYGEKIVQNCPPGLWFNPNLLVCDYPYHSGCIYARKIFED